MRFATKLFQNFLMKFFSFMGGYCLAVWIVHLVIMSFVAFFHFLLGHHLSIIEEWAIDNGWQIIFFCKLIALYITFKFIAIRDDSIHSFWQVIRPNLRFRPSMEFFVIVTFLFLFSIGLGNPVVVTHTNYNIFNLFLSFVGISVFFISDILVINSLNNIYRLSFGQKFFKLALLPLLLFIFYKWTFLYGKNIGPTVYFTLITAIVLGEFESVRSTESILFILFFIAPFSALFGLDPLWGSQYSVFKMSRDISISHQIIVFATISLYLVSKNYGLRNFTLYTYLKVKRAMYRVNRSAR